MEASKIKKFVSRFVIQSPPTRLLRVSESFAIASGEKTENSKPYETTEQYRAFKIEVEVAKAQAEEFAHRLKQRMM